MRLTEINAIVRLDERSASLLEIRPDMETLRLSKFLAHCGVAARRKADDLIRSGVVYVNNVKVLDPYVQVDPYKDTVTINNLKVSQRKTYVYFALYKPPGYLSDLKDAHGRPLAVGLLRSDVRLFPVGRLDYRSEGLMIFTSDGEFANRVMHPRYAVEKEYLVKLKGRLNAAERERALAGVVVNGDQYRADRIDLAKTETANTWYRITVHEGKNRMIRRLADALGHPVIRLIRVRIGPVKLGSLKPGQHRRLTRKEIDSFFT